VTYPAARIDPSWDALCESFLAQRRLGMKPDRERRIRCVLRRLRFRLPGGRAETISADVVSDYLQSRLRDHAAKTVKEEHGVIGMFCRWLVRQGVLSADPVRDVPAPRVPRPVPHYLSDAQLQDALRVANERGMYVEVVLAANTGLRLAELRGLTWADVDSVDRSVRVRHTKSDRDRIVPLTTSAAAALEHQRHITGEYQFVFPARQTWPGGWKYVNRQRATSWWVRALKRLRATVRGFDQLPKGSTGRGWHMLRHTFASRLVQQGVDVYRVASWLGHSDVRMTQRYAHLRPGWDNEINRADTGVDTDTGGVAVPPPQTDGAMP
jgi:integrase/recombinase XerD